MADREFETAQYTLRATFYYRQRHLWESVLALRERADHRRDWSAARAMGISERAEGRVRELGLPLSHVFAHPELLRQEPQILRYYRCLALLPQKGLQRLATSTKALEEGRRKLSLERALNLALVLNGVTSFLIESDPDWTLDQAEAAALLNLGSQINGSWRNAIWEEGDRQVKALLISLLQGESCIAAISLSDGSQPALPMDDETSHLVREIVTTNNYRVRFSSEPDVAIRDPNGILIGTIEVKYGSDPAGALERYGAARKSFDAARHENAKVQNIYLTNVITPELKRRIDSDQLVNEAFEFRRIAVEPDERQRFLRFVTRRLLDL